MGFGVLGFRRESAKPSEHALFLDCEIVQWFFFLFSNSNAKIICLRACGPVGLKVETSVFLGPCNFLLPNGLKVES